MIDASSTVQPGPGIPPYDGPFDIPVLIDDVKSFDQFRMTRCTFFLIEATEAVDDWVAQLRTEGIPFLLLGLAPVLHRPSLGSGTFRGHEDVDDLFTRVEDLSGLVVESSHIWLPNFLFTYEGRRPVSKTESVEGSGTDTGDSPRGDVYRISFGLFQQALQFQRELLDRERFEAVCRELMEAEPPHLAESPEETVVFREWSARQLADARLNYENQKEDPQRPVLEWRDEGGKKHAG